ncbi:MAG: hypothetical protein Q8M98_10920 [Candidatus Cloacimonadaceae bacterium]|nr:hypothetical protein [Candidatus Cloacimonadaceae bacterium]
MKSYLLFCVFLAVTGLSAAPAWFTKVSLDPNFFIGNGSAMIIGKDEPAARDQALRDAITDIAHQVFTDVRSFTQNIEREDEKLSQTFIKDVQIQTGISICNFKPLKSEREGRHWYTQISINREELLRHYMTLVQNKIEDAIVINDGIGKLIEQKHSKDALMMSKRLRGLLDELHRDAIILGSLHNLPPDKIIPQLSKVPHRGEVDYTIIKLSGNPVQEYKDLADDVISMMDKDLQKALSYSQTHFEWMDTGFASDFSVNFGSYLAAQLENRFAWKKAQKNEIPAVNISGSLLREADCLILLVKFSSAGKRQSIPLYISSATIARFGEENIKPKDLEIRLRERRELSEESVLSKNLQVSVKSLEYGRNSAVFRYEDKANILVRANRACYVTLVYIEANGERNLLTQNYFIASDMANQWIFIKDEFEICEPSGIEQLWLQADVLKLPAYEVKKVYVSANASKNIVIGLSETLALTRGIKIKNPQSSYTEDYLSWTVME